MCISDLAAAILDFLLPLTRHAIHYAIVMCVSVRVWVTKSAIRVVAELLVAELSFSACLNSQFV